MNTKRAFDRAIPVHEGARRTFGYGVGKNCSLVANQLSDQSLSYPPFRRVGSNGRSLLYLKIIVVVGK